MFLNQSSEGETSDLQQPFAVSFFDTLLSRLLVSKVGAADPTFSVPVV